MGQGASKVARSPEQEMQGTDQPCRAVGHKEELVSALTKGTHGRIKLQAGENT